MSNPKNQRNMEERIINNIAAYIWLGLTFLCLGGVIFAGAYWHIWTALLSFVMYRAMYTPKPKNNKK